MRNLEEFSFEGKLGDDGRLQGTIRRAARGDSEVVYRLVFRRVEPAKWKELVQNISYNTGFAGTVDDIKAGSPLATDQPFEFSYSYDRKDYSDWSNRQITPPLPGMGLPSRRQEDEKSVDPLELGAPSEFIYRAKLQMPPSYVAQAPSNIDASNDFAEYHARYELKEGVLSAERRLTIKQHEVPVAKLAEWKKLTKAMEDDTGRYIVLAAKDQKTAFQQTYGRDLGGRDPEAVRIFMGSDQAFQRGDYQGVAEICRRVLAIDPKFPGAWARVAAANLNLRRTDEAFDAFRKELEINPEDAFALRGMAETMSSLGKPKDAMEEVWRKLLKLVPEDVEAAKRLSSLLISDGQYAEVIRLLEPAVERNPQNAILQNYLGTAYVRSGEVDKGIARLKKAVELRPTTVMMNNLAYDLADQNTDLELAEQWAGRAVREEAEETQTTSLEDLQMQDVQRTELIGDFWGTLGWVYFRQGELAKAEPYLSAAWELSQAPTAGDALAQLYEKQGKRAEAAKIYAQALRSPVPLGWSEHDAKTEIEAHFRRAAVTEVERQAALKDAPEALSRARTVRLPKLVKEGGNAEFFVLVSTGGKVEEVKFISGSESFRALEDALRTALAGKMNPHAPLNAPVKLVRRAVVFCSPVASGCDMVLMTPDTVHSVN
jgi:tetratricopeptide (TPR) repeat protein